jgi:hypothetical protein
MAAPGTRQIHLTNGTRGFARQREPGISQAVHRVIRKRIRINDDAVNLVADIDAVISINTGGGDAPSPVVRSSQSFVQGNAGARDQPETSPSDSNGPTKEQR